MLTPQAAWSAVNQAVEANLDPMGMTAPLLHAQLAWLSHPQELAEEMGKFSTDRTIGEYARDIWHAAPCPVT